MLTSYDFGRGKVGLCLQPETYTFVRASEAFPPTAFIENTCSWSYRVRGALRVRNELHFPIELGIFSPDGTSHVHLVAASSSSHESQYFFTLPEILDNGKVMYRPVVDSSQAKADYQPLGRVQDLLRGVLVSSNIMELPSKVVGLPSKVVGLPSKVVGLSKDVGLPDGVQQTYARFKKLNVYAVADLRLEDQNTRVLSIVHSLRVRNLLPVPIDVRLTSYLLIRAKPCEVTLAPGKSAAVAGVSRSPENIAGYRLQLALPSVGLANWSKGLNRLDLSGKEKEDVIALSDGRGGELHVIMKIEKTESKFKDCCIKLYVRCCLVNRTGLALDLASHLKFGLGRKENRGGVFYARNAIALNKLTSESADIVQSQPVSVGEDQIVLLSPSKLTQKHINLHLRLKGCKSWSQQLKIDGETQAGRLMLEGLFFRKLLAWLCIYL